MKNREQIEREKTANSTSIYFLCCIPFYRATIIVNILEKYRETVWSSFRKYLMSNAGGTHYIRLFVYWMFDAFRFRRTVSHTAHTGIGIIKIVAMLSLALSRAVCTSFKLCLLEGVILLLLFVSPANDKELLIPLGVIKMAASHVHSQWKLCLFRCLRND